MVQLHHKPRKASQATETHEYTSFQTENSWAHLGGRQAALGLHSAEAQIARHTTPNMQIMQMSQLCCFMTNISRDPKTDEKLQVHPFEGQFWDFLGLVSESLPPISNQLETYVATSISHSCKHGSKDPAS